MTQRPTDLPALLRQRADRLGAEGRSWVASLPGLVADLERRWSITVGEPLSGGSASYVARARTADGVAVVLKVALPDKGFAEQVATLRAARGRGYANLLAWDLEHRAALLEVLGPALDQLGLSPEAQMDALCTTLHTAWEVPLPARPTLAQAQAKGRGLADLVARLWDDLGRPCSQQVITLALEYAQRRVAATDLDRVVVVHGDPHPGNALQILTARAGAESGFVFVDPDGFVADPAYDVGVVLRDWCAHLLAGDTSALARHYCRSLAARSGLDATAIWEWGYLERVSTGLYLLQQGAEDLARPFLETAERLVRPAPGQAARGGATKMQKGWPAGSA